MKFTFRFASVLKLRQYEEKIEKQKLAALFSQKSELQEQLADLDQKCRQNSDALTTQTVATNRRYYAQKHAWHKQRSHLQQQLSQLHTAIESQRRLLAGANQQTKKMEKLKQNEKEAFIQRVEEQDQQQQNEIAIQRYNAN